VNDEQRNVQMQHLVAEIFELAGSLRRDGEQIAKLAGQTQARWQVMWIAATGRLIVADGLATFQPNPDHQRSPLLILTNAGQAVLDTINDSGRQYNLKNAAILGDDAITEIRRLILRYRDALRD
jgi:hypothetical protein